MNRRDWLKKAAIIASGAIAADQLEILERLTWTRTVFPAASVLPEFHEFATGFWVTQEMLDDDAYIPYIEAIKRQWIPGLIKSRYDFESDSYLITPCNQGDPCTLTTKISLQPQSQITSSSVNFPRRLNDSPSE